MRENLIQLRLHGVEASDGPPNDDEVRNPEALPGSWLTFAGGKPPFIGHPVSFGASSEAQDVAIFARRYVARRDITMRLSLRRARAARPQEDPLIYVGQGRILDRVRAHLAKARIAGHRQAPHFSQILDVSWVGFKGPAVHLLEHENDLIASHVLTVGSPPVAQFIG